MTGDVLALPQWAQRLIMKLQSDLEYHKTAYQDVSSGESHIRCSDMVNPPLGLPERNIIEVDVRGGTLELSLRNGVLEIRAEKAVLIQSSAGNALKAYVSS